MEDGLFYSESALLNRVLFYSDYNDINIFVEDEFKEFIYENIFQRMFNYKIKINKILPMKGKKGVEKAFQEYGGAYDGKPAIYLVDGDFDLVMGKEMISSPRISDYDIKYDLYKRKFETILSGDTTKLVCGKYLLASLSNYLREKADVRFKEDDFIYFLASFFDIKTLDFVKERIVSIINARQL